MILKNYNVILNGIIKMMISFGLVKDQPNVKKYQKMKVKF